jgi:hypothetical protein
VYSWDNNLECDPELDTPGAALRRRHFTWRRGAGRLVGRLFRGDKPLAIALAAFHCRLMDE